MIVYKITNLINGKIYVGKDSKDNPDYFGSGVFIKRAIIKYGKENFVKEVIEYCESLEELNISEKKWINDLGSKENGYNIADGGDGGKTTDFPWNKGLTKETSNSVKLYADKNKIASKGKVQSESTKSKKNLKLRGLKRDKDVCERISNSLKGKSIPEEVRQKISSALLGRKLTEEVIEKMRNKRLSEETKLKISNSLKGRKKDPNKSKINGYNRRKIHHIYDTDNNIISTIYGKFSTYCIDNRLSFRKIKKFYNLEECLQFKTNYLKVFIET